MPCLARTALAALPFAAFLIATLLGCDSRSENPEPSAQERPNVLLVTFDTTRADRIGCYGYEKAETPHLDALAAAGARFENAYATTPVTLPSHASLLTGWYPPVHGVRDNGAFLLPDSAETLAERLSTEGYQCAAFVSSFVVSRMFQLDQGFEHYDDRVPTSLSGSGTYQERSAQWTTDAVLEWLDRGRDSGRPLFMWVHYFDPHRPLNPPEPFRSRHADDLYDGEIAATDAEFGRLLDAFEQRGLSENTMVIATADHGESNGEHGEKTHGVFIYDATMRVPLIISAPDWPRGVDIDSPVSLVDVMPTVLGKLGLEAETNGQDLFPLLSANEPRDEAVYMESEYGRHTLGWAPLYGLRHEAYKYIEAPREELYALDRDPGELTDLAEEQSDVRDRLRRLMHSIRDRRPPLSEETLAVSSSMEEKLRQLGYTGLGARPEQTQGDAPDPKDRIQSVALRDQGLALMEAGQIKQAELVLRRVLRSSPNDKLTLSYMALIAMEHGDYLGAERWFKKLLSLGDASATNLANMALCSRWLGRRLESKKFLDLALSQDPTHCLSLDLSVSYHRDRAIQALGQKRYEDCLAQLDKALGHLQTLLDLWYGDDKVLQRIQGQFENLTKKRGEVQALTANEEA